MIDATIPERAAGKTTLVATLARVAPRANAPSRRPLGHGGHRVLGDRGDDRHDHQADRQAAGEDVEDLRRPAEGVARPEVDQHVLGEEVEREEAEGDRRDPGEDLEDRLERLAHAGRRVLAEVDRAPEPDRDREDQGPEGDAERADHDRQDAEAGGLERRGELGAEEEVGDRHLAEELDRRLEQRDDDRRRRDDGEDSAGGEKAVDDLLAVTRARRLQPAPEAGWSSDVARFHCVYPLRISRPGC